MNNVKIKILVVDDNLDMRMMVKRVLAIENKYLIKEACNGNEALDIIPEFLPDLIIIDFMMPEKNGMELCLALQKEQKYRDIKFLGISGITGEESDEFKAFLGEENFFAKPFLVKSFKEKVNDILEKK